MSGHSKWSTIKRKKGAADAKRGKIFSRIAKEIAMAAKAGGGDAEMNPKLRTLLLTAKSQNMPKENVERAIKRGTGELPGVSYEENRYEGYGTAGVALIIDVLTDNKNRTVAEIRHLLGKHNGALAESGAVTWNFEPRGRMVIDKSVAGEDAMFEKAIEAGAEDVDAEGDVYVVYTAPQDVHAVAEAFSEMGIEATEIELIMDPKTTIKLQGKEAISLLKLMDALEEHDDVQNVFANFDISEEDMAAFAGE